MGSPLQARWRLAVAATLSMTVPLVSIAPNASAQSDPEPNPTVVGPVPTTEPYRTRVVVRRPADPTRADGTVILEWINVTAQFGLEIDCNLRGAHIPFAVSALDALYPNRGRCVSAVSHATDDNPRDGFLLTPDAEATRREAANSDYRKH